MIVVERFARPSASSPEMTFEELYVRTMIFGCCWNVLDPIQVENGPRSQETQCKRGSERHAAQGWEGAHEESQDRGV